MKFMSSEMGYESVVIRKSGHAEENAKSIGISDEEIKMVIHHAEATGEKLFIPGEERFFAKTKIGEKTFYVEYSRISGNEYEVHNVYAYKPVHKGGKLVGAQTVNWHCFKCGVPMRAASVNMEYRGISGAVDGIMCPRCGETYLFEDVVKSKVLKAEKLIDAKTR